MEDLTLYPGGDLVMKGLIDLQQHQVTEEALLLLLAAPRMRDLGFAINEPEGLAKPYTHALYSALEERLGKGAHSAYNALIGRIVSFAETYSFTGRRS